MKDERPRPTRSAALLNAVLAGVPIAEDFHSRLGAELISCHTGWNEQAAGKTPDALLDQAHPALQGTGARLVAMGGLKSADVPRLHPYADAGSLHSLVSGSAITRTEGAAPRRELPVGAQQAG
ncbi:hypothetical protein P2Q00_06760 [Streptomyces coacervatus]|uniref:hypothetical protein n=1 Tax=Streptomyces coacervatus TaxID=647381 RepID=UPI0023DCB924|nr:hypothetical protein [Streptomyces coacervatus]MDF2265143.1 hypothetical protein [Streptomyces coacervatus]